MLYTDFEETGRGHGPRNAALESGNSQEKDYTLEILKGAWP